MAAYPQGAFYTTVRQDIAGSSRGRTRATLQGCQVRSRDWETKAETGHQKRCRLSKSTSTSTSTKHQHQFKKAVAKAVSGWISPGCRGLDSFIGKVVDPRDARVGKGGSQTRAKVETAQALGTWGGGDRLPDCQIASLADRRTILWYINNLEAGAPAEMTRMDPDCARCFRNRKCRHWYRRRWWEASLIGPWPTD